jgi:hypothetical protein
MFDELVQPNSYKDDKLPFSAILYPVSPFSGEEPVILAEKSDHPEVLSKLNSDP